MKQRLEGYLSSWLKNNPEMWYQKNQVNQLAHTQSVGDFLILTKNKRYVVECKETKVVNEKFLFPHDRVTQLNDLMLFDNFFENNASYILFLFWTGRLKKSGLYIVPVNVWNKEVKRIDKKSFNHNDFKEIFGMYELNCLEELKKWLT